MNRTLLPSSAAAALLTLAVAGATTAPAAASPRVPFKASDSGSAEVVGSSGDVIRTKDVGVGHGTHVGRYTLLGAETINVVTGAITEGSFTLTAANGDTLSGTYSGEALPGLTGYTVTGPVTGGTGRFAGVSGSLRFDGVFDPATLQLSDRISGTLVW